MTCPGRRTPFQSPSVQAKLGRVDHLRGAVGALGLEARDGIGQQLLVVVEPEAVAGAGAQAGAVGRPSSPLAAAAWASAAGLARPLDHHRHASAAPGAHTRNCTPSSVSSAPGRAGEAVAARALGVRSGCGLGGPGWHGHPNGCDSRATSARAPVRDSVSDLAPSGPLLRGASKVPRRIRLRGGNARTRAVTRRATAPGSDRRRPRASPVRRPTPPASRRPCAGGRRPSPARWRR